MAGFHVVTPLGDLSGDATPDGAHLTLGNSTVTADGAGVHLTTGDGSASVGPGGATASHGSTTVSVGPGGVSVDTGGGPIPLPGALPTDVTLRGGSPPVQLKADATLGGELAATLGGGLSATLGGGQQPLQALVGTVGGKPLAVRADLGPLELKPLDLRMRAALAPTRVDSDLKVGFSLFGCEVFAITVKGRTRLGEDPE